MSDQIVPLTVEPNQTFRMAVTVNGARTTLNLVLYYNEMAQCWVMDLYDQLNNPLVTSTPLLTGLWPAANMLCQQGYLAIGSVYILDLSNLSQQWPTAGALDEQDYPDNTNLGTQFTMLWGDNT